jgi:hypothetical protein
MDFANSRRVERLMSSSTGMPALYSRLHVATVASFAAVALVKYVYVQMSGILVSPDAGLIPSCAVILLLGALCMHRGFALAGLTLNTVGLLFLALSVSGAAAMLVLHTGRDFGFIDDFLAASDALLGFHWPQYVAWALQYPQLVALLKHAYLTILWQPLVLILFLIARRDVARIYGMMHAMVLALIIASVLVCFFPALGPYAFYGVDSNAPGHAQLVTGASPTASILWLRSSLTDPMPSMAMGLIYFPSYHAVAATVYAWAAWRAPVVRWIFLGLNAAMLVATPLHGSHYLTDVVAGVAVAALSIWLANAFIRRTLRDAAPAERPAAEVLHGPTALGQGA